MDIRSFKTMDYLKYSFPIFIVLTFLALLIQFKGNVVNFLIIYISVFVPMAIILTLIVGGIAFFNRCEKCGTCFNKTEIGNDVVGTRSDYKDMRKQRRVGTQVHRVPHPDRNLRPLFEPAYRVTGVTDIYEDVIVRETTITKTIRHTFRCSRCGNISYKTTDETMTKREDL